MIRYKRGIRATVAAALAALALVACSGGGGTQSFNAVAGITTASISGAVSGSTFVAADAATNAEVGRVTADVPLVQGYKTFSLNLAPGRTYKFYLVENDGSSGERVFPLYQGSVNKFLISAITTIDLGFIATDTGVAIPANDMTQVQGVAAAGADTTMPPSLAGAAFTGADLAGKWNVLQISGGSASRWMRSSISIDGAGKAAAAPYVSSSGSGTTTATSYSLSTAGTVTLQGGVVNDFRGFMSRDKGKIIGTYSPNPGEYALILMVKSGATYTAADLQGTWKYNRLLAGSGQAWERGDATVAADGTITVTGVSKSTGSGSTITGALSMDAAGVVTDPASTSFYGVMSGDKDLIVALATSDDGMPGIAVYTRTGDKAHGATDMQGSWQMSWLSVGDGTSTASYYGRAVLVADSTGYTMKQIDLGGVTASDRAITVSVDDSGAVLFAGTAFSGTFSLDGTMIVGVLSESNGDSSLYTLMK